MFWCSEITRTIYLNSEMSEQFLVTEGFFNLFLEVLKIPIFWCKKNLLAEKSTSFLPYAATLMQKNDVDALNQKDALYALSLWLFFFSICCPNYKSQPIFLFLFQGGNLPSIFAGQRRKNQVSTSSRWWEQRWRRNWAQSSTIPR